MGLILDEPGGSIQSCRLIRDIHAEQVAASLKADIVEL